MSALWSALFRAIYLLLLAVHNKNCHKSVSLTKFFTIFPNSQIFKQSGLGSLCTTKSFRGSLAASTASPDDPDVSPSRPPIWIWCVFIQFPIIGPKKTLKAGGFSICTDSYHSHLTNEFPKYFLTVVIFLWFLRNSTDGRRPKKKRGCVILEVSTCCLLGFPSTNPACCDGILIKDFLRSELCDNDLYVTMEKKHLYSY